jgi:hypothetical protein
MKVKGDSWEGGRERGRGTRKRNRGVNLIKVHSMNYGNVLMKPSPYMINMLIRKY